MWHKVLPYILLILFTQVWPGVWSAARPPPPAEYFLCCFGRCGYFTVRYCHSSHRESGQLPDRAPAPRRPASCSAKPNHFQPSPLSTPDSMPANFSSCCRDDSTSWIKKLLACLDVSLTFWSKWFEFSQQKLLPKLRELMISGFQPNNGPNCELSCSFANNFYFLPGRWGE